MLRGSKGKEVIALPQVEQFQLPENFTRSLATTDLPVLSPGVGSLARMAFSGMSFVGGSEVRGISDTGWFELS